jgi:alpha-D-ribose 1-methylphosphonate 5-triphosphate synthase subunit PhnH
MNTEDLTTLGAGFSSASFGSQAVFRTMLHALAHPGEIVHLKHDAEPPPHTNAASAVLLLAVLDPDCTLWLSPSLAQSAAAGWLRFHTGCTFVTEPDAAQFAWIASGDALPPFDAFAQGSDTYPDQSATCVVDAASFACEESESGFVLTGPGIETRRMLAVNGLSDTFADEWRRNHDRFPRGVDLFLCAVETIVGLPRTTRVVSLASAEV